MSEHEARVLKVDTILPHSNADALEIVKIWDYNCVVKKGQFNLGDLVVFLEPDTNVPLDREEFSFLKNPDKPERTSHRLTVKKLRGVPSQGLLIAAPRGFKEGDDTWQHFGLTRWEPGAEGHTGGPKGGGSLGSSHAEKGPEFKVPHYDLENARKYFKLIEPNEEVLLTNKIHGSQFKATYSGGRMYAGSRNMWKKEPGYYFHEKPKTTFLKLVLKIVKYISGGNAETVFNYCIKSKHKFIRILNQHLTYQVGENAWWTALRQNDWIESWCNKNPNAVLYGEVYGCFSYKTPITLSDGSKKMIGEIVNNELPVEVRTLNINTGLIENKKVVGWSKQKASKEDWMYLSYKRKHHGGRKTGLKLTKNHTVYTKNFEEVRAETLKVGDVIYLYSKFTLNYIQEQFILGTLLGDGYLSDNHILQINHSIKQKDLVDLKKNILYNVISKEIKKISGHGSEMCGFLTKSFHNLSTINFFDLCYSNNGKKLVTKSWLNKLTPISLAFWYMDDGSLSNMEGKKSQSILHTNSFSDNEINLICEYFNNLGLDCYKCSDGKNGQIVKFTPTGTERFNCLISPYIHKSMKYKLLTEYKNVNYILDSLLKTTKTFHKNYIETTVQTIDHNPCFANDLCYKFDIEVEDNHNFFANNILVHNCSVQGANFHYGLKAGEYGVAVFDILENGQWINNNDIFFNKRFEELKTVQLLYKGPFNMQKVAELAEAKETFNYCGHVREGVVIKLVNEREDQRIGRIAIKYVSDNYLMKS